MARVTSRWNHNIHYHPLVLDAVPPSAAEALDVGCGEGMLARELSQRVGHVTAIDLDEPSIDLARRSADGEAVEYILGDFLTHPFEPESFDTVVSVATLHHMDTRAALTRMRSLLRPGGVLALIGLTSSSWPRDLPRDAVASVATRILRRSGGRTFWHHSAPTVWPPPEPLDEMRRIAESVLPGVEYRRLLLWRYFLRWTKPAA